MTPSLATDSAARDGQRTPELPTGVDGSAGSKTTAAEPASGDPVGVNPWRRAAIAAFGVWIASVIAHTVVAYFTLVIGNRSKHGLIDVVAAFNVWDSPHYLEIAAKGYLHDFSPAFFPAYPLAVRYADVILPQGQMVAALSVSYLCAFFALLFMFRLAEHEFGTQVASRATWYLAAFPASFALFAAYNTSMFIMLAVGALYFMRRGRWWIAGAFGAVATGTRLFGILLSLPMVIEYLRTRGIRGIRLDVLGIALVPAGLAAYSAYCWIAFGNPLAFSHAQAIWQREYVIPGQALWDAAAYILEQPVLTRPPLAQLIEFASLGLAVVLLILSAVGPWRLRRDQFYLVAYGGLGILLLCSTEVHWGSLLQSAPRYTLEAVPIFLVLARIGARQAVDRLVVALGFTIQAFLLMLFLNNSFVA